MLEPYVGVKVEIRRSAYALMCGFGLNKKKMKNIKDDQDVQGVIQILVMRELSLMQVCLEE